MPKEEYFQARWAGFEVAIEPNYYICARNGAMPPLTNFSSDDILAKTR